MILLQIIIAGYLLGLFSFYYLASFNTLAWDIVYFGWAKTFDVGLLMWAYLFYYGSKDVKKLVKWLYVFSVIRLAGDVQTYFTGIGVNNNPAIAVLYLCLLITAAILLIKRV